MNGANSDGAAILIGTGLFFLGYAITKIPWAEVADIATFIGVLCLIPAVSLVIIYLFVKMIENRRESRKVRHEMALDELERKARVQIDVRQGELVPVTPGMQMYTIDELVNQRVQESMQQLAAMYFDSQRTYPNVPKSFTHKVEQLGQGIPDAPSIVVQPPTAREIINHGQMGKLWLGTADTGTQLIREFSEVGSSIVSGGSGMGKTTLVRSMIAQTIKSDGQVFLADPQAGSGEESLADSLYSIRGFFGAEPAQTPEDIRSLIAYVNNQIDKRTGDDKYNPINLYVDECTIFLLSDEGKESIQHLLSIAVKGRKVGVNVHLMGQLFKSSMFDSSLVQGFTARIALPNQRNATGQVLYPEQQKAADMLLRGQALYSKTGVEDVVFSFPDVTMADVEASLGGVVAGSNSGSNPGSNRQLIQSMEPALEPGNSALGTGPRTGPRTGPTLEQINLVEDFRRLGSINQMLLERGIAKGSNSQKFSALVNEALLAYLEGGQ